MPVTSFNTRTGEVILLEDDVLAALGYVPLNKHGDTMTGPLILPAGNPPSANAAASKAYVDANVGPGTFNPARYFPRTWWLADFNASGSPATFTGSITSGSRTLTLTSSTHDFVVGQGIAIQTAGNLAVVTAGSNLHVSTITAIAGAVITIADPAAHTATGKTVQHDDTVALQTAINTALAAGSGKVVCDAGHFRLNGPLTDINSIIKFPFVRMNVPVDPPAAIWIEGPRFVIPGLRDATSSSGTIFQTDRIGANSDSSVMATAFWTSNPNDGSALSVYMSG